MKNVMITIPYLNWNLSLYVVLMAFGFLMAATLLLGFSKRHHLRAWHGALYSIFALVFGTVFGRLVYCCVRFNDFFYDELGQFVGFSSTDGSTSLWGRLADLTEGNISIVGIILGCLFAAFLCKLLTKKRGADYLDCAVIPGLFYFIFARLIEPMNNQGFGDLVFSPLFCNVPLGIQNSMGDWSLSVCFIEAALAVIVLLIILILRHSCADKSGSLALYALALLACTQILPESLRRDDVLFMFIFARVTQMFFAALFMVVMFIALARDRKVHAGRFIWESFLSMLLIGINLAGMFALEDKLRIPAVHINWSFVSLNWEAGPLRLEHTVVYIIMGVALLLMALLACRRIRQSDKH